MTNRLERLALQHGVRVSNQRRAVLIILDSAADPLSAQEIKQRALEVDQRISLATIRRTLHLLTASGLLRPLEYRAHKTRYEKTHSEHRERLIDLRTGRVLEVRSEGIETLLKHAVGQLGYRLLDYRLEMFGIYGRTAEDRTMSPTDSPSSPSAAMRVSADESDADGAASADTQTDGGSQRESHRQSRQ